MKWRSLGKVFHTRHWAQCPTPLVLDDRIRVYFSERDDFGKSFIRFVDLDINDPTKLLGQPSGRVLENGDCGTFDDEGQIPSAAASIGGEVILYYSGWNSRNTVPYHNATGVAYSIDGGFSFHRRFHGPVLDRTPAEPYLAVTPSFCAGMTYYVSGLRWKRILGRYEPIYTIHAARSQDGIYFERMGQVVPQFHNHECFSRPWAMKADNGWFMYYSYRSAFDYRDGPNAYRIGYAVSQDGIHWLRNDAGHTPPARSDWDATMQCYPALFYARGKFFMLYNGNSFGREGFGLAVAE
jgi:hypothetical protein